MNCKHANMEHNNSFDSLFAQHLTSHSYQSFHSPGLPFHPFFRTKEPHSSNHRPRFHFLSPDQDAKIAAGFGRKASDLLLRIWSRFPCTSSFGHYPFGLSSDSNLSLLYTHKHLYLFPHCRIWKWRMNMYAKKQGYSLWWTAMHNAAFCLIYIHSNTHMSARTPASTHRDSYHHTRRETGLLIPLTPALSVSFKHTKSHKYIWDSARWFITVRRFPMWRAM